MTFGAFPLEHIRATALALNVVAASYATVQVCRAGAVEWPLFMRLIGGSMPGAIAGGMIVLHGPVYSSVTGAILLLVSTMMIVRVSSDRAKPLHNIAAFFAGAIAGLASGLTGVGGGVFMSSILILFGNVSPKTTAVLSPPFILVNSLAALVGVLIAGQTVPLAALPFALAAVFGSAIGSAIGARWMSARAIRYVLASVLLIAAGQMLIRSLA
jgi:uncharacterized membrane protein YfcA